MPILITTRDVSVFLVYPDLRQTGDDWQGKQKVDHLICHEVRAKLAIVASADIRVYDVIVAELDSKEAQVVVMGCYAKNAISNWIPGPVAIEVLENANILILMTT